MINDDDDAFCLFKKKCETLEKIRELVESIRCHMVFNEPFIFEFEELELLLQEDKE